LILSGCGDPSSSGFEKCMCGGAYDAIYSDTFNQAFKDCVACENGGGAASGWEATCCAKTGGCTGMSAQARKQAAKLKGTDTQSSSSSGQSTTSSGIAPPGLAITAFEMGWAQLLIGALIGFF
jgi:hypothetical protein